jgi:hypothetical protein
MEVELSVDCESEHRHAALLDKQAHTHRQIHTDNTEQAVCVSAPVVFTCSQQVVPDINSSCTRV